MAARKSGRASRKRVAPKKSAHKRTTAAKRATPRAPAARKKAARGKTAGPGRSTRSSTALRRRPVAVPAARSGGEVPSRIALVGQHMDYTSHAMEDVKRFYTEWLGFSQFEEDPTMSYLMVRTGPSSSIGFMPPMPGPPDQWRPPREPNIYLIVEDVDRVHRELEPRGVVFEQAPQDMPWGHRVAVARDPEGRTICFAQITRR